MRCRLTSFELFSSSFFAVIAFATSAAASTVGPFPPGDVRNLNLTRSLVFRLTNQGDCSVRIEAFDQPIQNPLRMLIIDAVLAPCQTAEINVVNPQAQSFRFSVGNEGITGALLCAGPLVQNTSPAAAYWARTKGNDIFNANIGNVGIGTTSPTAKLDVRGAIAGFGVVPIGTIVAWHKSLQNTPPLSDGWTECNGQPVNDPNSPFNGQNAPNLNSTGQFLRGNNSSGVVQADAFQDHTHSIFLPVPMTSVPEATVAAYGQGMSTGPSAGAGGGSFVFSIGTANSGNASTETRPANMSVVWIMRIK